jgi:hypothetical protein
MGAPASAAELELFQRATGPILEKAAEVVNTGNRRRKSRKAGGRRKEQ